MQFALALSVPPDVVLALGIAYARGLQAAHEAGIIHCDVSPQNLFVTFAGEGS